MVKSSLYGAIDELSLTFHLENCPLGIIALNNRLEVIYWSSRATEIFEWTKEEVLGRSIDDLHLVHKEDVQLVSDALVGIQMGTIQQNQSVNKNYNKSGKTLYCEWYNSALKNVDGSMVNIVSMVHDITDQKKAEIELERRTQQLEMIYNSAIDPMWLINVEGLNQYRFENINESFTEVTGLPREKVIGFMIEEVLPGTSHQLVNTKYNEAVQTGKVIDYTEVAVHPAGKKVGEIRVIPVKNKRGDVIKIVGIAHDISEKQMLQDKLDKERDEVNKKITAAAIKGQEVERNNVSRELHDNINQVLTTVKLYIELCATESVNIKETLQKCSLLLNETINEIRSLSKRLSAPVLTDVSLHDSFRDLVESVQATKEVKIDLHVSSAICRVIDADLHLAIYRIAQEQLTNILKHAKATKVWIKLSKKGSLLCLAVIDNGIGFDATQKIKGLGITNMISRASLLNGTLNIDSTNGNGCHLQACFRVKMYNGKCYPELHKTE